MFHQIFPFMFEGKCRFTSFDVGDSTFLFRDPLFIQVMSVCRESDLFSVSCMLFAPQLVAAILFFLPVSTLLSKAAMKGNIHLSISNCCSLVRSGKAGRSQLRWINKITRYRVILEIHKNPESKRDNCTERLQEKQSARSHNAIFVPSD